MNRKALLLFAVLPLVACRPDVLDVEVKGETTIDGDPAVVPGLLNVFPGISSFNGIDFSQTQEFQNQGVTKDDVESVKVRSIRLKIISPDTQDYSFLEQLQFFARAGDQEVLVGEKLGIDKLGLKAPNPVLELDLKDEELQPFVVAPSMSILVRGRGKHPPQRTRLEATVNFDVQVKIF